MHAFSTQSGAIGLLLVLGVVIGVPALLGIIAQIPRKNPADTYRLDLDGALGRTLCEPSVLARAVEEQVNMLLGVVTSSALLRGTTDAADLTLNVTVNDQVEVRDLHRRLETSTLADPSTALETPLPHATVADRCQRSHARHRHGGALHRNRSPIM